MKSSYAGCRNYQKFENTRSTTGLLNNCIESKYGVGDETNGDTDEINDSATSSSFSLQECMNEFRARRVRRRALFQRMQELKYFISNSKNVREATEIDIIKQNLCNKAQEREDKLCRNGFCYCFTSDSESSASNLGCCRSTPGIPVSSCKIAKSPEKIKNSSVEKLPPNNINYAKNGTNTNKFKTVSILEANKMNGCLIHIVHELRNNCVTSTVTVNRQKTHQFVKKLSTNEKCKGSSLKKGSSKDQEKTSKFNHLQRESFDSCRRNYTPIAPIIEEDLEIPKNTTHVETKSHGIARGQLLRKRITKTQKNYKSSDIIQAPPKPPRTLFSYDDKYCAYSSSTSSSLREAVQTVDDFLANKGFGMANVKSTKKTEYSKKVECVKNKSNTHAPINSKRQTEDIVSTYPPLSNTENIMNNGSKPLRINSKQEIIKDMFIHDVNSKLGNCCDYNSAQFHPERDSCHNFLKMERATELEMPHKINLDTVDGIVHNLVSNLEDKNTPMKMDLLSTPETTKNTLRRRKFLWSEQLRYLYPWSNKNNANDINENLSCSSLSFVTSSKKKLLRFVSPKKDNKKKNNTQMCNVAVQTSCGDIPSQQIQFHNQDCITSQSPPGSYHSPIQESCRQDTSSTQSQNTTPNRTLPQFNFSKTVHSPPKKPKRSSQRKLSFPLNFTFGSKKDDTQNRDHSKTLETNREKTYHSFNSEIDKDASLSKINYVLKNIRTKLEASDQHAVETFQDAESVVNHNSSDFDCLDENPTTEYHTVINKFSQLSTNDNFNEPIYSEIEDDSVCIPESSYIDNDSGIQHFFVADNPNIIYTKINKSNKCTVDPKKLQIANIKPQISVYKVKHNSLKSKKYISDNLSVPTIPEPSESESVSYSSPLSINLSLSHCQSLNNVQEIKNNSNSILSLHRSEMYLENLCRSELVDEAVFLCNNLKKDNKNLANISKSSPHEGGHDLNRNDTVPYNLPSDEEIVYADTSTTTGSNSALSTIVLPLTNNQSTPKKQSFIAKYNTY